MNHFKLLTSVALLCGMLCLTFAPMPMYAQAATKVEGALAQGTIPSTNPIAMAVVDPTGNSGSGKLIFMRGQPSGLPISGVVAAGADGLSASQVLYSQGINGITGAGDLSGWLVTTPLFFNGTTYDRARGNTQGMSVTGWSGQGPTAITVCDQSMTFGQSITATQRWIIGTALQRIHICSVNASAITGPQAFSLYSGTGTNCGANTTNVSAVNGLPYNDTRQLGGTLGQWVQLGVGHDLCVGQSFATQVTYTIAYTTY